MKTYAIKIALRGVSPMIWRRLRIADKTSLASLHDIIQTVQGWTDDHLHCFHIYGKDYGICYDGGLSFPDNVFKVVIDDFKFDAGDRFTYEYNFYEPQLHDIRIESIDEISSRKKVPFCLDGHGVPGVTEDDVYQKTVDLLQFVAQSNDLTTVREALPYIHALDTVQFNRKKLNRQLAELNLSPSSNTGTT
jgi:hypothetical protein